MRKNCLTQQQTPLKKATEFRRRALEKYQTLTPQDLRYRVQNVIERYHDELAELVFLYVSPDMRLYYQVTTDPFGEECKVKFPSANSEIIEAYNCYAFERYTACVFHLMRACEVGIKALYKTLDITSPKLTDSWGNLLRPMDDELKKNPNDRCSAWSAEVEFFDNATNDVRAIKRAWRDSTMHIQSTYDDVSALKVLRAVESVLFL
jgi:hypothetical protein